MMQKGGEYRREYDAGEGHYIREGSYGKDNIEGRDSGGHYKREG